MIKKNNKVLWSILFFLIAALTIWTVIEQNGGISIKELLADFQGDRFVWLIAAVICVGLYVWFEGAALLSINRSLGHPGKFSEGILYSAADIYCSAITPSATGGQPASAYFMIKRGVPGTVATVSLLVNLIMYTLSILAIGIICLIFKFNIILELPLPAQILIYVGISVQVLLVLIFLLLLRRGEVLWAVGDGGLRFLGWLRLLRHSDRKRVKLRHSIQNYRTNVHEVAGQGPALIKAFFFNLLQRTALIAITGLVCLAMGGNFKDFITICALHAFVILATSWIPIPGAMGITDYLFLVGFANCWPQWNEDFSLHLELCSRGISFYACVLLCGSYVLLWMIKDKIRKCKN